MKRRSLDLTAVMRAGPVIAIVTVDRVRDAVPVAAALRDGGVKVLEVTLRSGAALAAIEAIASAHPDVIVGAGTARRPRDFRDAASAGARFVVSPGFTAALAEAASGGSLPWLPGVATASEVMLAQEAGLNRLKFFPAQASGGVETLRGFAAVFADALFCPTGGLTSADAPAYLALSNVECVGGSWLAPRAALASRDWGRIRALAEAAAALPTGAPR